MKKRECADGPTMRRRIEAAKLTIPEFAHLSGVPERTVYRWVSRTRATAAHPSALRLLRLMERDASTIWALEEIADDETQAAA